MPVDFYGQPPADAMPPQMALLAAFCHARGHGFRIEDEFSKALARVERGGRSFLAGAHLVPFYPLNPAHLAAIARDKAHTADILARGGLGVPRGQAFFVDRRTRYLRPAGREIADALAYARRERFPLFVKPNSGSQGALAETVHDEAELLDQLLAIRERDHMALVQEVIDEPEYRVFVVGGAVAFTYRRSPPALVGNGRESVRGLLARHNDATAERVESRVAADSPYLRRALARAGWTLDTVPEPGIRLRLSQRSNLAGGGALADYSEAPPPALSQWVARLLGLMPLAVCGIDLFAPDGLDRPDRFRVIEVNSNPSLLGLLASGREAACFAILDRVCALYFGD
ncbi:MAG: hypothetical protein AB7G39_06300 [Alphaproteobacteria bacterium]